MGLEPSERRKVPNHLSVKDCYQRIYQWLLEFGLDHVKTMTSKRSNLKICKRFIDRLPVIEESTAVDRDFIFQGIISGPIEWFYHARDENDIKLAAYSFYALEEKYNDGFYNKEVYKNAQESFLATVIDQIKEEVQAEKN